MNFIKYEFVADMFSTKISILSYNANFTDLNTISSSSHMGIIDVISQPVNLFRKYR